MCISLLSRLDEQNMTMTKTASVKLSGSPVQITWMVTDTQYISESGGDPDKVTCYPSYCVVNSNVETLLLYSSSPMLGRGTGGHFYPGVEFSGYDVTEQRVMGLVPHHVGY